MGRILRAFAALAFLATIGLCGALWYGLRKANESLDAANSQLSENTQTVFVATEDVSAGEPLLTDGEGANLELQTIYTGVESYNYITDDDVGKVAAVPIPYGTPVYATMVAEAEIANDTRDYECSVATLMVEQREYDTVDVRISFPTGEDYIVLSKKLMENMDLPNCVFYTRMSEEEILRMNSAIIDAYLTPGCRIYTTRYLESNLQEEAAPTYPVREAVYDLINSEKLDPNVMERAKETLSIQARLDLEKRLGDMTEEELDSVEESVESHDEAIRELLTGAGGYAGGYQEEAEPAEETGGDAQ